MLRNKAIKLLHFESIQDTVSGDRTERVCNDRNVIAEEDLVGIQTQNVLSIRNIIAKKTYKIQRNMYNNEVYLADSNEKTLYEILSTNKAKLDTEMYLVVKESNDEDKIAAYEEYINDGISS
jgi:hypothetical protein